MNLEKMTPTQINNMINSLHNNQRIKDNISTVKKNLFNQTNSTMNDFQKAILTIEKAVCYQQNVLELLKQFEATYIDPVSGKFKVSDFNEGMAALQMLYDKIKETALECHGEEVALKLGDSATETILKLVLGAINFKL